MVAALVVVPVLIVMVVMMMVVAALVLIVVIVLVVRGLLRHDGRQHVLGEAVVVFHRGEDLRAGQLIPRRGDDARLVVVLAQQVDGGLQLLLRELLGAGEQDGAGILDLVEEEFAEVLDVHAALHRVRNGHEAAHLRLGDVLFDALHGADDVRELAHAGRLDEDAVGVVLVDDLFEGLAEVAHQRAADAAGVHLRHLNAGLLHEAAVDADLAELVFNQDDLLAGEGFPEQLLDERGLARAEEAGKNINFGHGSHLLMGSNRENKNQPEFGIPTDYCTPFFYEIQGFRGKSQFRAVTAGPRRCAARPPRRPAPPPGRRACRTPWG